METVGIKPAYKVYDAGFVQRREWMLYKIRADHYPLNVSIDFEIDSFDPSLTQKAINLIVKKHEVLRTTLAVEDGKLKQIIHSPDQFEVKFAYFDMKDRPETEKSEFIKGKLNIHKYTPFNFEFGPLFRVAIFELMPARFSVHFVFHHMVLDEHSIRIFTNDLNEIFQKISGKVEETVTENVVQYREYSFFENELLETEKGDKYRRYWEGVLANGIPELVIIDKDKRAEYHLNYLKKVSEIIEKINRLPCFDLRFLPSVIRRYRTEDAGQIRFAYSQHTFKKIKAYKEEGKNGLLSLFVGSLILAFYRLSGQDSFAFEIPGSSRISAKFNQTMGWLTTGGPCYFEVPKVFSASGFLNNIDTQLYLLAKHCIFPPEAVGYTATPPLGGRMPVFLTLSYLNEDITSDESGIIFSQPNGHGTYQDLAVFFTFWNNAVTLNIIYNNFLFNSKLVELIIDEHLIALEGILNDRLQAALC